MAETIIYDYSKLNGRIIEKFGSKGAFAEALGWKLSYLSKKLRQTVKMQAHDIERFRELLEIELCDIGDYFFTRRVEKN